MTISSPLYEASCSMYEIQLIIQIKLEKQKNVFEIFSQLNNLKTLT